MTARERPRLGGPNRTSESEEDSKLTIRVEQHQRIGGQRGRAVGVADQGERGGADGADAVRGAGHASQADGQRRDRRHCPGTGQGKAPEISRYWY